MIANRSSEKIFDTGIISDSSIISGTTKKAFINKYITSYISNNFNHLEDYLRIMPDLYHELELNFNHFVFGKQVHGRNIEIITSKNGNTIYDHCDGFITAEKGIVLNIITADCVPIFLHDPCKSVIAILHSGWVGTYLKIAQKGINVLREKFKCNPENILVHIGPSISYENYEVSSDFTDYFPDSTIRTGNKTFLDLKKENENILISCGIDKNNISTSNICTYSDVDGCYSFRREGYKSQRLISFMMMD